MAIAEFDIIRDRNFIYVDEMRKAGKNVEFKFYKNAVHGFQITSGYPPAAEFQDDAKKFIRTHTKDSKV